MLAEGAVEGDACEAHGEHEAAEGDVQVRGPFYAVVFDFCESAVEHRAFLCGEEGAIGQG